MSWKQFSKNFLIYTRKNRIGIFVIVFFISTILLIKKYFSEDNKPVPVKANTALATAIDTLEELAAKRPNNSFSREDDFEYTTSKKNSFKSGALFTFDPNTLSTDGWKRLGLNDKTIKTINNYRTKGGKFYKPEDINKIWGMPEGFYERIEDYIEINSIQNKFPSFQNHSKSYEKKERKVAVVNINSADTAAFIALPGIGSKLAFRITNFRDKLGGFHSVDQIAETYGLSDSTFQIIKPYLVADDGIKKLNINTTTKDELKMHPYIKWNLANAIVEYRNQHGDFTALEQLKKIVLIDEATYNKISPYLSL